MAIVTEDNAELKEIQKLEGHSDRVWGLAWNPTTGADGVPAVLASCSGDKTVKIWQQSSPTSSFHLKVFKSLIPQLIVFVLNHIYTVQIMSNIATCFVFINYY